MLSAVPNIEPVRSTRASARYPNRPDIGARRSRRRLGRGGRRGPCCDRAWRRLLGTSPGGGLALRRICWSAPITCPVRMPPPASTAALTCGQWSRLLLLLSLGVRPNSPHTTTETSLSSPRSCRSVTSAERPESEQREIVARLDEVHPVAAVPVPAAVVQGDVTGTRFDQAAGQCRKFSIIRGAPSR